MNRSLPPNAIAKFTEGRRASSCIPMRQEDESLIAGKSATEPTELVSIYEDTYLKAMFDEMQSTYERVSTIASFGFNWRWRRQLVELIGLRQGMHVGDLMAGSGESWTYILPRIGREGTLVAVDFSSEMIRHARQRKQALQARNVAILHEDALHSSIPPESQDAVVCIYGVKTLSPLHQRGFVSEVRRILKAGGVFGLVEVSVPDSTLLRLPYMFYLGVIVPLIGKLLLGNPDNYRMLGVYTAKFGNCRNLTRLFAANGFDAQYKQFFWGCASAVVGVKR